MKKKVISLMLALVLLLGLAAPALAYNTPDFTDVPTGNWAYDSVMRMADRGIVKGTGNKMFSPNGIATAEQFITLIGRIVFPDVKATGSDWSGPYVAEAKSKGLLDGTNVNDGNLKGEISRYDMAVILAKAVELLKVSVTKADSSKVTDYGEVPTKYVDAVLTAYGSGLITGDENHNFNGQKSMRRNELTMVMDRLLKMREAYDTKQEQKAAQEAARQEHMAEVVWYHASLSLRKTDRVMGKPAYDKNHYFPDVPVKLYYTPDGGKTSTLVAEGVTSGDIGEVDFIFQAPRGWGDTRTGGNGFYASAETTYNGERLVTNDLRTDDKAFTTLFGLDEKNVEKLEEEWDYIRVELTPPTGAKAKLTFQGGLYFPDDPVAWEGFTVRLFLKDGTLLGEATTGANGRFKMEYEVDAIDNGFDPEIAQYYYTASGVHDGVRYENSGKNRKTGEWLIYSLNGVGSDPDEPRGEPIFLYPVE